MSAELVDTRGEYMGPGKYTFTIADVPQKGTWKEKANYYDFRFLVNYKDSYVEHKEKIPVWQAAPLLRAIGAKEVEQGVFEWDKEASVGTMFDGEIVMEKGKDGIKEYRKLINPIAIDGFPKNKNLEGAYSEVPF